MTEQGGAQSFIGGGGQNNLGPLFGEVGEARLPPGKQGLKLRTGGGVNLPGCKAAWLRHSDGGRAGEARPCV